MGAPFAGTPIEDCIKRAFIDEVLVPFEGELTVPYMVKIEAKAAVDPKKDPKKPEKAGPAPLPTLPDAGPVNPAVKLNGCKALKHAGTAVTLLSGVPCNAIVAWAAEVGKAP